MKNFEELNKTEILDRMLSSEFGTLYSHLDIQGNIDKIIRFLDGKLTPELLLYMFNYMRLYYSILMNIIK